MEWHWCLEEKRGMSVAKWIRNTVTAPKGDTYGICKAYSYTGDVRSDGDLIRSCSCKETAVWPFSYRMGEGEGTTSANLEIFYSSWYGEEKVA